MDTVGEPPSKRVKRTHRGRTSEWYFLGLFAFVWLAQNYGTTSDRNDRSIETKRGMCGTGETTSGCHRAAGQMLEERMNPTEASVRDTSLAGGTSAARCKRHLELTMDDSDLERLRRDTNQRTSVTKTLDGVSGPECFVSWAGRVQRASTGQQVRADPQGERGREAGRDFAHAV